MFFFVAIGTGSAFVIILVLTLAARRELHARYASWWILFTVLLACSISIYNFLHKSSSCAAYILLLPLVFIMLKTLYFDMKFSKLLVAYRQLAQSHALLEERVQELDKQVTLKGNNSPTQNI